MHSDIHTYAHVCTYLLTIARICTHTHTFAHKCALMHTYAHICKHMHTHAHARRHAKIQRAMHLYMYSLDLCMHRSVRTRPELRKVLPLSRQQNHQIHNKFIIKLIVSGRPTKSLNSGFWSTCPKLYEFYYEFVVVFIKLVTGKGGVLFSGQGA